MSELENRIGLALSEITEKIDKVSKRLDAQHTATQDIIKRLTALETATKNAARKQ